MKLLKFIKYLFRPSDEHKGIRPIQIYVLKLFFLLMFVFASSDAWAELLTHKGEWNPEIAVCLVLNCSLHYTIWNWYFSHPQNVTNYDIYDFL